MQNTGVDESIPGNAAIQSTMELLDRDPILASNTRPEISADKQSPFFFVEIDIFFFWHRWMVQEVYRKVLQGVSYRLVFWRDPLDNNYSMFGLLCINYKRENIKMKWLLRAIIIDKLNSISRFILCINLRSSNVRCAFVEKESKSIISKRGKKIKWRGKLATIRSTMNQIPLRFRSSTRMYFYSSRDYAVCRTVKSDTPVDNRQTRFLTSRDRNNGEEGWEWPAAYLLDGLSRPV